MNLLDRKVVTPVVAVKEEKKIEKEVEKKTEKIVEKEKEKSVESNIDEGGQTIKFAENAKVLLTYYIYV